MQYKSPLISAACIAALALCTPLTASAQFKKTTPSPTASPAASPPAKAPRSIPFRGKISAVDQTEKTFSIAGKEKTRTFKIVEGSVITKDGKPGTMADLAENDDVTGSYWKREDGSLEVRSVKAGAKTESETSKPKKQKEKAASPSPTATP
jgi:hypothetical protein